MPVVGAATRAAIRTRVGAAEMQGVIRTLAAAAAETEAAIRTPAAGVETPAAGIPMQGVAAETETRAATAGEATEAAAMPGVAADQRMAASRVAAVEGTRARILETVAVVAETLVTSTDSRITGR
jgi:hypothetical protein